MTTQPDRESPAPARPGTLHERHRLTLRTSTEAIDSLAAPIGGQQRTPAADVFSRLRAASGDR